ncbi:MAG TPA: hypothetical protein IGS17_13475 [Oscillatoriales cyanobacterium M59_W2019_021]|nr:MAG: hypothetical protein D6728_03465 [Cyanobacteria bacterium J055]HIK30730.1 hypothetical protein [Oscillatoriales cyanobacterium M4454_W2019_049]HIK51915.1 hypothetical protein [Oscillatoriales cyanobacterium M59_W2019_021]
MTPSIDRKLRMLSYARIKRQINYNNQYLLLFSRRIDRQKTCKYNADSAFLLCAVNPSGPCSQCSHYEPKERR